MFPNLNQIPDLSWLLTSYQNETFRNILRLVLTLKSPVQYNKWFAPDLSRWIRFWNHFLPWFYDSVQDSLTSLLTAHFIFALLGRVTGALPANYNSTHLRSMSASFLSLLQAFSNFNSMYNWSQSSLLSIQCEEVPHNPDGCFNT